MMRLRIADYTLARLVERLGEVPPEQGGALLGLPGADMVTGFVHDADAHVTETRYRTSSWLIEEVDRVQVHTGARFKGIAHSHPLSLAVPSAQDTREVAHSLALNPQLARYLAPIVTHDVASPLAGHELLCGPARVSWYGATLVGATAEVFLAPMRPVVVPIAASLERAGARILAEPVVLMAEGTPMILVRVGGDGLDVSAVMFGADFPTTPPVLIGRQDDGTWVPRGWDLAVPAVDRFACALADRADPPQRRPVGEPVRVVRAVTRLGCGRRTVATRVRSSFLRPRRIGSLFARSGGLLAPELQARHVLVVGAGSVGGYVAECFVRSGIGCLTLIDPDIVAPENLGRTNYTVADIGQAKVGALTRRLRAVNPRVTVKAHRQRVGDLDPAALLATIRSAHLLVAATDDNVAQRRLDQFAYWAEVPAIFPGLYRRAAGGEVIMTYPGSACWGCATAGVRGLSADTDLQHPTDYGSGRLIAEPGLLVDIQYVAAAATKIGLALLHSGAEDVALARFVGAPRRRGQSYVALGTEPDFWLFPDVLGSAVGQHAFQSVWMGVDRDPACPVCGPEANRVDPTAYGHPRASRQRLLALADVHRIGPTPPTGNRDK